MHTMLRFRLVGAALALTLPFAGAAAQGEAATGQRVQLFSSDSIDIVGGAALSSDGRWLAFSMMEGPSRASLWVVSASGGEPVRLTSPGHWDGNPDWSPAGDVLYFTSNRPAAPGDQSTYYGMAVPFDSRTGRATGELRQITREGAMQFIRPSPDGRMLAFVAYTDRRLLKVVPSVGGEARIVTRMPERSGNVAWSQDGRELYFVTTLADDSDRLLQRVAISGGEPIAVTRNLPPGRLVLSRGAEVFLVEEGEPPRERVLTVMDRSGTVLNTITVDATARTMHFAPDGRSVIVLRNNVTAPTRVMPITGGAFREITPRATYDWVMRWTPDGSGVYTWTEDDGSAVLAMVPLEGTGRKIYRETSEWGSAGANAAYLFQTSRRQGSKPRVIAAVDLRDGSRHTITEAALPSSMFPSGPGGTWAVHDELYYYERDGAAMHIKSWSGPGAERAIRTVPAALIGRTRFAVHGSRVAWQEQRGDSLDVMITDGPDAAPRRLFSMGRMNSPNELAFSNDGRLLALHYSRGPGSPDLMAVADVAGATPPRIIDTGLAYWYWPRWLPDDSGIVAIGGGRGAESHVVLIPLATDAQPRTITSSDSSMKWGFELSPDGRYIAYPGEVWQGSSVWRIPIVR